MANGRQHGASTVLSRFWLDKPLRQAVVDWPRFRRIARGLPGGVRDCLLPELCDLCGCCGAEAGLDKLMTALSPHPKLDRSSQTKQARMDDNSANDLAQPCLT